MRHEITDNIRESIKLWMSDNNYYQKDIAELLGVTNATVTNWLNKGKYIDSKHYPLLQSKINKYRNIESMRTEEEPLFEDVRHIGEFYFPLIMIERLTKYKDDRKWSYEDMSKALSLPILKLVNWLEGDHGEVLALDYEDFFLFATTCAKCFGEEGWQICVNEGE